MKWMKLSKIRRSSSDALIEQVAGAEKDGKIVSQSGRRGVFGLLKKGLGVAVVATGAAEFFKEGSGTAHADTIGSFSSSVSSTPAVDAMGVNGALGVQVFSDGPTAITASSYTPSGSTNPLAATIYAENSGFGPAIIGESPNYGVWGRNNGQGIGVYGSSGSGSNAAGVYGHSASGMGVGGDSNSGTALYGFSNTGTALYGSSSQGYGMFATSSSGPGAFLSSQFNL